MSLGFGRFLELALSTQDITVSAPFYGRLGFASFLTGDAWQHRYGVVGDGHIHLGLHEWSLPTPAVTFVLPHLQRELPRLSESAQQPEQALLSGDQLHQLRLRDPGGNAVLLLEARTFSPTALEHVSESLCGYFLHLSLPQSDFQAARAFWEVAGLIPLAAEEEPYPHLPLTGDQLNLAFHPRQSCATPLLVFACAELDRVRGRLDDLGIECDPTPPMRLDPASCLFLRAPEGTELLLVATPAG
jgi:hypothetical protein